MMIRNELNSSVIRSVEYDPVSKDMHVQFMSGKSYTYSGVSAADHNALMSADSHGRHLNSVFAKKYSGKPRQLNPTH